MQIAATVIMKRNKLPYLPLRHSTLLLFVSLLKHPLIAFPTSLGFLSTNPTSTAYTIMGTPTQMRAMMSSSQQHILDSLPASRVKQILTHYLCRKNADARPSVYRPLCLAAAGPRCESSSRLTKIFAHGKQAIRHHKYLDSPD